MKTTPFVLLVASFLLLSPMAHSATITVNTTDDENNTDGDCSLREAVISANTDAAVDACTAGSGSDEITIPAGTYTLSVAGTGEDSAATGDLDIMDHLTLTGAGADTTIIDANGIDRVIHFVGRGSSLVIKGLKITGGSTTSNGGGILAGIDGGSLTLQEVIVSGNELTDNSGVGVGGGGGISAYYGLTLINSTVSGNTIDGHDAHGGGIFTNYLELTLINSTVSGNTATNIHHLGGDTSGGGIYGSSTTADITLINSTISGNSVSDNGGGIYTHGDVSLFNTTVAFNTASDDGGGVYFFSAATSSLENSIISDNTAGDGPDCYGTIDTLSYSLIKDTTGCTISSGTAITGDPSLEPLGNYGGSTETHRPGSKSIAIDAGNPAGCVDSDGAVLTTDQRGTARPLDGNGDGTAVCDIGAFERAKFSTPGIKKLPSGLKKKP